MSMWIMLWRGLRFAARTHLRRPVLGATAVGILALGIGLNVSAVSVLNALLLHPYPYPSLDRLVLIRDRRPQEGAHQRAPIASGDYIDIRRDSRAFVSLTAWKPQTLLLTGTSDPQAVEGVAASAAFFEVLGVSAEEGRTFSTTEDQPGHDNVVVLSHRLWVGRFAADASLIGRDVTANGRRATVIGIIADENCYPSGVDAWVPLTFTAPDGRERTVQRLTGIARLKTGASITDAEQELAAIARRLARLYPETNRGRGFALLPLQQEQYEFTEPLFLAVQVAALFVLGLGLANVAQLLLAWAVDRQREFAVRRALGASGSQLFGQVALEALVPVAIGGSLALLLAYWAVGAVRAGLPEDIARWVAGWRAIRLDSTVVASAAMLTAATGIVLAVAMGLGVLRASSHVSLKDGGRSVTGHTHRLRRLFMAGEVCLAVVLLIAAGLMLSGFRQLGSAFETLHPDSLLAFGITLPEWWYSDDVRIVEFQNRLVSALTGLPGVSRVALIRNPPASNVPSAVALFTIEGRTPLSASEIPRADLQVISVGGFDTLDIVVPQGRGFRDADDASAPPVAIVSRAMARRFWPGDDAVGRIIHLAQGTGSGVTIVGVAADFKLNWYDPEPRSVIYLPSAQAATRHMEVMVRTTTEALRLAGPIRAAIKQLDSRQPVSEPRAATQAVNESLAPVRVIGWLLLICGGVAAVFAATGIHAVLAHGVASRTRELGVRVALGARPADLVRLVSMEAAQMAVIGMAVGVPLALAAAHEAKQVLFSLPSPSLEVAISVVAVALAIVLMAAAGPTRRALRADPRVLLQAE